PAPARRGTAHHPAASPPPPALPRLTTPAPPVGCRALAPADPATRSARVREVPAPPPPPAPGRSPHAADAGTLSRRWLPTARPHTPAASPASGSASPLQPPPLARANTLGAAP